MKRYELLQAFLMKQILVVWLKIEMKRFTKNDKNCAT